MQTDTKFLFLDTETTSIMPSSGQVIEIGAILADLTLSDLGLPETGDFETNNLENSQNKDSGEIGCGAVGDPKKTLKNRINISQTFEILIGLRGEMDDKITRITGITKEELLVSGKNLEESQKNWIEWLYDSKILPKNNIIHTEQRTNYNKPLKLFQVDSFWSKVFGDRDLILVGHSIDFDLDFLDHEGWLRDFYGTKDNQNSDENDHKSSKINTNNLKIGKIDTLNWAKFFLADQEAINLEALTKTLNLDVGLDNRLTQIRPHRALYDSFICLALFEYLIHKVFAWKDKIPDSILSLLVEELDHRSKM